MAGRIVVAVLLLAHAAFWVLLVGRFVRDRERMNRRPLLIGMGVVAGLVLLVTVIILVAVVFNPATTFTY